MKIGLNDSSASSSSSVDNDYLHVHTTTPPQRLGEDTSLTPWGAQEARPRLMHSSSSSISFMDDTTPDAKRVTHLDRVNEARRLSMGARSPMQPRKAASPAWMRVRGDNAWNSSTAAESDDSDSDDVQRDESDTSESDSEEDEWPVAPNRTGQSRKEELLRQRQASVQAQEMAERIRLSGERDSGVDHRGMMARRVEYRSFQQVRGVSTDAKAKAERAKADFDQVQSLLAELKLKREGEEAREKEAFEARNKALWDNIDAGIREAEEKREQAVREEQDRLRKAREQREAAEKRAREMKEAEEARIRKEREDEERKRAEEEGRKQAEAKAEEERAREAEQEDKARRAGGVGVNLEREAREAFELWSSKMQRIKTDVLPVVSQNEAWRKQCFTAKRSITRGVSQLTNSRTEIERITRSIGEVLAQARGATPTGEIYTWILNHLSKCLIRQAEQEVAAKQDTAFPLARVVVWLLLQGHEQLGEVLMARLVKKCCWCLPHCPGKKAGQDDAGYAKVLGKAGKEETPFAYTTRMSGIMAFYFAICQTKPTSEPGSSTVNVKLIPSQFRTKAAWTWQARAMSPRLLEQSLSPALWTTLVEVAGPTLLATYGRQTVKVWRLMLVEGLGQEKAGFCKVQSANSAKARLKELLQDWSTTGLVQGATGGREMEP